MAHIQPFLFFKHLRAETTSAILLTKRGRLVRSGRGLSFFFFPMGSSISEVALDERDLVFFFTGRTGDFQEVTAQGTVTYRVVDPERFADRIDCSLSLRSGRYLHEPMEQVGSMISELAQQLANGHFAEQKLLGLLAAGTTGLRSLLESGLREESGIQELGIEIVAVRIAKITPSAETERALQIPTLEGIQEEADEAQFQRRALGVEKERAIEENELNNRIELARQEADLISQDGENRKREATERAEVIRIEAEAESGAYREIEEAKVEAEEKRIGIYEDLPPAVLLGLAARDFAGKLQNIEHLNITPDMLSTALTKLAASAGAKAQD